MLDPQEIYLHSADAKTEKIAHIYEEYRKELRKANALDFDDQDHTSPAVLHKCASEQASHPVQ